MASTGTNTPRRGRPPKLDANRGPGWDSLRQRTKRLAVPLTPEEEEQIKTYVKTSSERSAADFVRRTIMSVIASGGAVAAAVSAEAPEFVRLAWDATTRSLVEQANVKAEAAAEVVRKMLGEIWALRKLEEQVQILLNPKATEAALAGARRELQGLLANLERMPREDYTK